MFIIPISMKIPSQEAYERDLKPELLKLGYKEHNNFDNYKFADEWKWLCTSSHGSISKNAFERSDCLPVYNPKLFLALASLTDEPIKVGDWVMNLYDSDDYRAGKVYLVRWREGDAIKCSNSYPQHNARKAISCFRKATKEQLIALFSDIGGKVSPPNSAEEKPVRKVTDLTDKQVIHCPTKEQARAIYELLGRNNYDTLEYHSLESNFCADPNSTFCTIQYYEKHGYEIFPAKDFLPQNNKSKDMKRILSRADFKRIHAIACSDWKPKLAEKFKDLLFQDEVEVDEAYYKLMRKACTPEQNTLFDEIFGKYNQQPDLQNLIANMLIRGSGNYKDRAIYLFGNDLLSYKVEIDSDGLQVLVAEYK